MWPLLVPAAVGAALVAAQRRIIYPSFTTVSLQAHPPADAEVLWHALGGADQSVEAWFLPAYREAGGGPAPLVVFAHGNAELIDPWPQVLSPYRNLGCHVLLPEYRSYGRSGGKPSEASICADVHAFVRKIIQRPDVDSSRVVFHGRSLGGGVLGAVAQRWSPRAAILESTFTSLEDLARDMYLPGSLVFDKYRTSDYAPAKAAVVAITECLAAEWGPAGIRVNAVSPGHTLTPALQDAIDKGERDVATLERNNALGRMVQPVEVARAVAFLASTDAGAITGINLPVDCGWLVTGSWHSYGGLRPFTGT